MKTYIRLPPEKMEKLHKAFADKYQREDRQSYFGGITTDEMFALHKFICDAKHYKLTTKDFNVSIKIMTAEQLQSSMCVVRMDPYIPNKNIDYKVAGQVETSYSSECPLTSQKKFQTHRYFITEKMVQEIEAIIHLEEVLEASPTEATN